LAAKDAELSAAATRIADLEEHVRTLEGHLAGHEDQDGRIAELEEQVTKLREALTQLREKLEEDSTNSNLPPPSDPPGRAAGGKRNLGKRKRGGQKGHRGSHRQLVPPEEVDEFVDIFPPECRNCWEALPEILDPFAKRYQHTELQRSQPHTTEYRRNSVWCPKCGLASWRLRPSRYRHWRRSLRPRSRPSRYRQWRRSLRPRSHPRLRRWRGRPRRLGAPE